MALRAFEKRLRAVCEELSFVPSRKLQMDWTRFRNRTGMIAVDQMASEIRLAEETAESGKNSLPIASNVVFALASPLGITRERETKARANQS